MPLRRRKEATTNVRRRDISLAPSTRARQQVFLSAGKTSTFRRIKLLSSCRRRVRLCVVGACHGEKGLTGLTINLMSGVGDSKDGTTKIIVVVVVVVVVVVAIGVVVVVVALVVVFLVVVIEQEL